MQNLSLLDSNFLKNSTRTYQSLIGSTNTQVKKQKFRYSGNK